MSSQAPPILLVTGGSRGIGAAIARQAAQIGWDVAVNYRSDKDAAEQVADQVRQHGRRALTVQADVGDESAVRAMFERIDSDLGRLSGLVNNAGIVAMKARVDDVELMTTDRWRHMFEVNVIGTMLCAQQAVLRMSTRHGGSGGVIVNISSGAARNGAGGTYVDYAASKAAVDTFTLGLAKEVAGEGIRAVGLRPGVIETDIHSDSGEPDKARAMASQVPLGRAGRPEEIAEAVTWLLSPAASYVTGTVIDVTGGR